MTLYIAEVDFTKYERIQSVRVTDGARLVASRVVMDENTHVRWTIELKDKLEMFIFDELQLFEDAARNVQKHYTTSELLDLAKQAGFIDWQQLPVELVEMWPWDAVGDEAKKILVPKYSLPDPTPYPADEEEHA